jgi:hypothetical protein
MIPLSPKTLKWKPKPDLRAALPVAKMLKCRYLISEHPTQVTCAFRALTLLGADECRGNLCRPPRSDVRF